MKLDLIANRMKKGMRSDEYLKGLRDPMPHWLEAYEKGQALDVRVFLGSRVVFYPGSGFDGQPIKLFGGTHVSHCFIYADYVREPEAVTTELADPRYGFRGYSLFDRIFLKEKDLTPFGWKQHLSREELGEAHYRFASVTPYGFIQILSRDEGFDVDHGPERLAILFLGADAVATYDDLFCQPEATPPFAMVVQDHGWGGQYTPFDDSGLLKRLATRMDRFPKYLLIATNTQAWSGYVKVDGLEPVYGGEAGRELPMNGFYMCGM